MLAQQPGFDVVGFDDSAAAVARMDRTSFDALVLCLYSLLPDQMTVLADLVRVRRNILVILGDGRPAYAEHVLSTGALGCVTKSISEGEFIEAVRAVAAGQGFIERSLAVDLTLLRTRSKLVHDRLSLRELHIMQLLANGKSTAEIAASLGVAPKTISNNVSAMRAKLGASSISDLMKLVNAEPFEHLATP